MKHNLLRNLTMAMCLSLPLAAVAGPHGDRMADKLELTESQRTEFSTIMEDAHAARKALRDSGADLSREQRRERMHAIRENTRSKLDVVLTEEQQAKLKQHHEARLDNKGKKRKGEGKRKAQHLAQALNLTDAQKREFKDLMKESRAERKAQRKNWKDLSPEQRRAQREQMRSQFEHDLNSILTVDQQARFRELREERSERSHEQRGRGWDRKDKRKGDKYDRNS